MSEGETLWRRDLAVHALQPVIHTFRRAHADAKPSALAQVHLVADHGKALRSSLPVFEMLRRRPGFKEQARGHVKSASDFQFSFVLHNVFRSHNFFSSIK